MVVKEDTSLLPTAVEIPSSMRKEKVPIRRTFLWLLTASLVLMFGWLTLLSVIAVNNMNIQPGVAEDLFDKFGRSQEVRCWVVKNGEKGNHFKTQVGDRRQLVSGETSILEGDIIVHHRPEIVCTFAHPDLRWPQGVVEYRFHDAFPDNLKEIVLQAMDYITIKVPCIKFLPKVESSPSFVTISDRGDSCSSALGRVGGEQELKLSRRDDVTAGK